MKIKEIENKAKGKKKSVKFQTNK